MFFFLKERKVLIALYHFAAERNAQEQCAVSLCVTGSAMEQFSHQHLSEPFFV
jgi:hypothetical protein